MIVALTIAGLVQASAWEEGLPVYRSVIMVAPFMVLRAFSGLLIVLGQVLLAYNVFKTLLFTEEPMEGPLEAPASLADARQA
jgi:cbb3-type cytochrome oxidase subunit 1